VGVTNFITGLRKLYPMKHHEFKKKAPSEQEEFFTAEVGKREQIRACKK